MNKGVYSLWMFALWNSQSRTNVHSFQDGIHLLSFLTLFETIYFNIERKCSACDWGVEKISQKYCDIFCVVLWAIFRNVTASYKDTQASQIIKNRFVGSNENILWAIFRNISACDEQWRRQSHKNIFSFFVSFSELFFTFESYFQTETVTIPHL